MIEKELPELLAPAGDLEKLKTAIHFGADAVYLGLKRGGLRGASKNFDFDDLREGVKIAHENNARVFVAMNALAHEEHLEDVVELAKEAEKIGIDAVVVSDPGILMLLKENTNLELHLSTQSSVTNSMTAKFWIDQGVKRIIPARELSIDEIRKMKKEFPEDAEIECFVHGAMCIAHSGRCLISNYMTGRDANRGDCAQSCRWKWTLSEEKRPGEYFPIEEDETGTSILSSRDLCLLDKLEDMWDVGVDSLKIEGRAKTQFYVGTVVHVYRLALDAMKNGVLTKELRKELREELEKASHRPFTEAFAMGKADETSMVPNQEHYIRPYRFVGEIIEILDDNKAVVEERNKIVLGDTLERIGRDCLFSTIKVSYMTDLKGNEIDNANTPRMRFIMNVDENAKPGDLLRTLAPTKW